MVDKWIYDFVDLDSARRAMDGDWDRVRGLLGGKGANLADMASLGVPVPPGFTITTEACTRYLENSGALSGEMWNQTITALEATEVATGKQFGSDESPLLVAVRSGAKFSMPGMMDTVLNVGINDKVAAAMVAKTGDARFVFDSYRRFAQMFGTVVLGLDSEPFERILMLARSCAEVENDAELSQDALCEILAAFKLHVLNETGSELPADPLVQLELTVRAVFDSWNSKRAFEYRNAASIDHDLGTAVNVVAMVFGNTGPKSGTGVAM